jgi:hypothetical protein
MYKQIIGKGFGQGGLRGLPYNPWEILDFI